MSRQRTTTVTLYTLSELKELHPEGYANVLERWQGYCSRSESPWASETMDSIKATVKAFNSTLTDYSLGTGGYSYLRVSVPDLKYEYTDEHGDEYIDGDGEPVYLSQEDAEARFVTDVLTKLGYDRDAVTGHFKFPGLCPLTGYCADEDFIQSVADDVLEDGDSLKDALQNLSTVAVRMMEADEEQQRSEETMEMNWGNMEFEEDGTEA